MKLFKEKESAPAKRNKKRISGTLARRVAAMLAVEYKFNFSFM